MSNVINGKILPSIAIGTWAWGSGANGNGIIFGTKSSPNILKEGFDIATKMGFKFFDTSAVYGMGTAEELLASFSKDTDIILSDKYTPMKRFKQSRIDEMYNSTVEKFGGRIPDIYFLHQPKQIEETLTYMCKMKNEGKIGSIGVSNFDLEQLKLADEVVKKYGCTISGVQNHYSLLYRTSEENGVINWCKENGVVFFAYMVLEQGALTGKFTAEHPMPRFSRRGTAFNKKKLAKIEPLITQMEVIAHAHGLSVSETAAAYTIAKGALPIIGVTKPYQAQSLIKTTNASLSKDEIEKLERAAQDTGVKIKASWE